jgi:hypothetical protein
VELRQGEQVIRVHRFRFVKPSGCGLGSIELVVEESLASAANGAPRCTARPDHHELVPRPEFTAHGETVEEALENCLAAIRTRRFYELFLPKA